MVECLCLKNEMKGIFPFIYNIDMKTIIFFILLPFTLIGQNNLYKITYSSIADIDSQVRSTDILYLNEKMAYYEVGKKEIIDKNKALPEGDGVVHLFVTQKEKITSFVYTDFKSRKLYNTLEQQNIYKSVEPIPEMNWVLTDESKEIEGVLLHKATLNFRGRNYEAWCNLDIPVSVGPWKFNGAPGLIYEIKSLEEDFSYYWGLKEFKEVNEEKKLKETLMLLTRKLDKDYRDLPIVIKEINEEDVSNNTISNLRLPDGLFVESEETEQVDLKEIRRKRAEIKYEWEE